MSRPRTISDFCFWLILGGLLGLSWMGAVRAEDAAAAPRDVTQQLIFLRAERPVFVQLTVLVDGIELRAARQQRISKTFASLDTNSDGVIDKSERDAQPKALRGMGVREKWDDLLPRLDTAPQDQNISSAEFDTFAQQLFGPPVMMTRRIRSIRRSGQAVELFDLLDENQDQHVSEEEFAKLAMRLHKLDADGDDSFSVIEVEPFRNPFGQRAQLAVQPEDSPWALIESAAEILLKKFDQDSPQGSLNAKELGVSAELLATGDQNKDGELTEEELKTWLPTVPPNYLLNVKLPQLKGGSPQLTWIDSAAPPLPMPTGRKKSVPPIKELKTMMAGQPVQLEVSAANRASQSDNLNFYKLQFRRADQDKNKYLNATEFGAMGLPGATFEMVDADGNGEVHVNELAEFLNLENLVDQGHVLLTYDSNETSLFSLLDTNKDNRLSPRECLLAKDAWKVSDLNHDQDLDRHELTGMLRLTVELVKPRLFNDATVANNMTGEPVISERTAGPVWFRGMDRNRDGDVSRREFLGTDESFNKWDKDQDGLISAAEAEQK